jgi:Mrp family chromosome partitioning ATPase
MSRNFDLLMEIQNELRAPGLRKAFATDPKPVAEVAANSGNDDQVHQLVQQVFLDAGKTAPRQVVFCPVEAGKEGSDVCAAVGRSLAASKAGRVCIVSANLRSARLSQLLKIGPGNLDAAKSLTGGEECLQVAPNLWFARADYLANEAGNLKSRTTLEMDLATLRGAFDYILIDAPAVSVSQETLMLGRVADAIVLVVEANKTRRQAARQAMLALDAEGIHVLGTVLTAAARPNGS